MPSLLGKPFNIHRFSINLEVYNCTQSAKNDDFQCYASLDACMDNQC